MGFFDAFLEGWRSQGKYPGVDPRFVKSYSDAVLDYQKKIDWRTEFLAAFQDSEEEQSRCVFTYQVLGFSMAMVAASVRARQSKNHHMSLAQSLDRIVNNVFDEHPPVIPIEIIPVRDERMFMHQIVASSGKCCTFEEFEHGYQDKKFIFSTSYAFRGPQLMKNVIPAYTGQTIDNGAILQAALEAGEKILENTGSFPSQQKKVVCAKLVFKSLCLFADVRC